MEMPPITNRTVLAVVGAAIGALIVIGGVGTQTVGATASHATKTAQATTTVRSTPAAANACDLVTPQEVTAAFGHDAGAPHFVLNTCVYDNGSHELIVALARTDAKAQFDAGRVATAQPVAGIGDNAYTWNGRLAVLKGSSAMLVTLVPGPASGLNPATLTLARAAVTRL
ncbi:MAG: hypothetical protein M3N98_03805 [Actinomycetota bacterium]|nr:hypothetical protein [Actinomycetota bacterium]